MDDELIRKLADKYEEVGEHLDAYLKGLLYSKPVTYWDYVQVETLLSIQRPRTSFKDEEVFILYHQLTELVFKMVLLELKQITDVFSPSEDFFISKMERVVRYTSLLITSFDIMSKGMDKEDYSRFRFALTPASGFQSVQFRKIEIYCTRLTNLMPLKSKEILDDEGFSVDEYFDLM